MDVWRGGQIKCKDNSKGVQRKNDELKGVEQSTSRPFENFSIRYNHVLKFEEEILQDSNVITTFTFFRSTRKKS